MTSRKPYEKHQGEKPLQVSLNAVKSPKRVTKILLEWKRQDQGKRGERKEGREGEEKQGREKGGERRRRKREWRKERKEARSSKGH